jgi:hypothetical protein
LLRVLLLRLGAVSTDSGSTKRRSGRPVVFVLRLTAMSTPTMGTSRDWLSSKRTNLLAWWLPLAIMLAGLFVPESLRAASWMIALGWMGAACMLNARRCNRTHCRYTGPYYLAMIVPVMALGAGLVTVGISGWVAFGLIILGVSGLIWWATERVWGKFS